MDWFLEELIRGQIALTILAFAVTAAILWFGRRKLSLAIPSALVFLLVAAALIPGMVSPRLVTQRNSCINNLRIIQGAKAEWAERNHKSANDIATEADLAGLMRHIPACPRGGKYTYGGIAEKPTCSLSHKGHKLD